MDRAGPVNIGLVWSGIQGCLFPGGRKGAGEIAGESGCLERGQDRDPVAGPTQRRRLEREGLQVIERGTRLFVRDYQEYLQEWA